MLRSDKERLVAELAERLKTTATLIVADYRGLSVTEIDKLRGELLEHGARFQVVKNTLTRRAAEEAGNEALLALLEGPTAIAFLESDGDPVAVAKALSNAARDTRILTIRGGILEGRQIGEEAVRNLAALPPADILRAQLVGAVSGPLTMVVGLFAAPLRDLVGVLDARIRQLEEQGDTAPVPEPEPEASAVPAAEEASGAEAPAGEGGAEEVSPEAPAAEAAGEPQATDEAASPETDHVSGETEKEE